jgi:hypothetical protein
MKHLTNLSAVLLAMAFIAAVGVSSAAATEFHATGGTALNGFEVSPHEIRIEGSAINCNVVVLHGTASASGTSVTQRMRPTYQGCEAFGIINALVNANNCEYEFNANTNTRNISSCFNAINIVAESGFGNCRANIPNQSFIAGQTFSNMGTTGSNTATLTEELFSGNLVANVTESNGICPINTGTKNLVSYRGATGIMGATGGTSF